MQVTSQTTVAVPIDSVWDKLTNHVGMSSWGPGITVTMDKPGTTDPNGVGAVRRISSPGPGSDIVEEVVTFEAPNLFGYRPCPAPPSPVTPARCGSPRRVQALTSATQSPQPPPFRWSRRRCGDLPGADSPARTRIPEVIPLRP